MWAGGIRSYKHKKLGGSTVFGGAKPPQDPPLPISANDPQ